MLKGTNLWPTLIILQYYLGSLENNKITFFLNFRYSSSERKCEKQFNEYIKDRIAQAKAAFRQLLVETKFVTDKSLGTFHILRKHL